MVPVRSPRWNALATTRAGLSAHVVEIDESGEVVRAACSNDGSAWAVVTGEESESVRLCGSCRRCFGPSASNRPLVDEPPTLPVAGVEWTSRFGFKVATTDEYRGPA